MARYRSGYSHGKAVSRMYRKYERQGAQALSKRELRLLRREMDVGVNPRRRNPRYAAPWSLRGSSLRQHWAEQQAKRATTRRYSRAPTQRYARANPRHRLNPLGCRMSKTSMFHELKHHASRWRPQKQRVAIVLSTLRKCGRNPHRDGRPTKGEQRRARRTGRYDFEPDYGPVYGRRRGRSRRNPGPSRRNPKRDGTPTRGELRKVKKSTYLKTIMQRGKDAEAILARIHAVPAASKAAIQELAPAVAVMEAPTPAVVAQVEHAEAKFLRSRIDELGVLHADLLSQIAELGDDDLSADDASMMQEQAVKIAKQRGLLRAKAKSLGIMTNPRPRHGRRVLVGLRAYGVALKRLHQAIRSRR